MNEQQLKNKAVIDIHNLNHYFSKGELRKQVLFDINLEIERGEIVLMTGSSGSGKTTLLTFVSRPAIALADELTAVLDSKSGRDAVNIMQKLAKGRACTILLVTHDDRILDVGDLIVHHEEGRLVNNSIKQNFIPA